MVSVQDEALVDVPLQDEDSMEFRMLMVYAQRTLPKSKYQDLVSRTPMKKKDGVASNGEGHAASDSPSVPPKKREKETWALEVYAKVSAAAEGQEKKRIVFTREPG